MQNIAIIGAGMSGLSAAHALMGRARVTVFDKSRGVSGRMSTRYAGDYEFDHGAQYFTVKSSEFMSVVNRAMAQGHIAPWAARAKYLKSGLMQEDTGGARFVATPRMNSWAKALADPLSVKLGARVKTLQRAKDNRWTLIFEDGRAIKGFDGVVCSVPPRQALDLLPKEFSKRAALKRAQMDVCFAVMLGLSEPIETGWDTLRVNDLPVNWLAFNSSKPGRAKAPTLMIQSAPEWSNTHAETDRDWVQRVMTEVASELVGADLSKAPHHALHRWLYAAVSQGLNQTHLFDSDLNIAACGDWCVGGRVEGAFLSGLSAGHCFNLKT